MERDDEFRRGVLNAIPNLRAFAISLIKNPVDADDLVQETIVRAWTNAQRFERGTCIDAWLFTILRNHFHSQHRRRRREVEDVDGAYGRRLYCPPEQQGYVDFQDLRAALAYLPPEQREAIILVGAHRVPYEEAATICQCPTGTIKSRVNRARVRLAQLLGYAEEDLQADPVVVAAMGEKTSAAEPQGG